MGNINDAEYENMLQTAQHFFQKITIIVDDLKQADGSIELSATSRKDLVRFALWVQRKEREFYALDVDDRDERKAIWNELINYSAMSISEMATYGLFYLRPGYLDDAQHQSLTSAFKSWQTELSQYKSDGLLNDEDHEMHYDAIQTLLREIDVLFKHRNDPNAHERCKKLNLNINTMRCILLRLYMESPDFEFPYS